MSLTPSQRINILKGAANQLANAGWSEINLVLKEFHLPCRGNFGEDGAGYFLENSKGASDEVVNGLAEHFNLPEFVSSAPSVAKPSVLKEGKIKIFISHLAVHGKFAESLKAQLLELGFSAFVAHSDIEPAAEWQSEIEKALAGCDSLVALLHPDFHESNWTDQEIGFAMGRGIPIFAVRLGRVPYGFIGKFQAFNGVGKSENEIALELFSAYRKHKQTRERMSEMLIGFLEESPNYQKAITRTGYIEQLVFWNSSFVSRLRAAVRTNSQIRDAWGVLDRLEAVITKFEPNAKKLQSADIDEEIPF